MSKQYQSPSLDFQRKRHPVRPSIAPSGKKRTVRFLPYPKTNSPFLAGLSKNGLSPFSLTGQKTDCPFFAGLSKNGLSVFHLHFS
jgi:hypothetical protein